MIPKKIHYCWFGRGEKPKLAKKCIESWKKYCPDYEIVEWNEDNFDIHMNGYTKMCYEQKKYAFLTDYIRLLVVAEHGGIYFDTDVEVVHTIDDLLKYDAFYCYEKIQIGQGKFMFERMKENLRQQQEKREQQIREEKNRLSLLSEKELLVEILLELKRIENRVDSVETSVRLYNN